MPTITVTVDYAVSPKPVVNTFTGFNAPNNAGIYQAGGSFLGAGSASTIYQMVPNTANKTNATSGTTQWRMLRFGGFGSGSIATDLHVGKLTMNGTEQGCWYHGVSVGYSQGAIIEDLVVTGARGGSTGPPGETFHLELWHAEGAQLSNIVLDGKDAATGASVGATGLQVQCRSVTANNVIVRNMDISMALALWEGQDGSFTDCTFSGRKPVNAEQCTTGTMTFTRCTFAKSSAYPVHMSFNSAQGSTKVMIYDPVVDAWPLKVGIYPGPLNAWGLKGATQTQKTTDVHLFIGGVEVTSDATKLKILTSY